MLSSKNDLHSPSYMLGLYDIFVLTTRKKKKKSEHIVNVSHVSMQPVRIFYWDKIYSCSSEPSYITWTNHIPSEFYF